jgi:hypothetical protein
MLQNHLLEFPFSKITLNTQQNEIVQQSLDQNLRILASAGSGKTTTITAKIAHAITNLEVKPEAIVLTTFSRSGADTMKEKLEKMIGPTQTAIGTFHALSLQVLKANDPARLQGMFTVDELPYLWLDFLQSPKGAKWSKSITLLVVDEFQDINDVQLDIIREILSAGTAKIIIVGDDAQNIYAWRGSRVEIILNMHEEITSIKDFQLTYNYRSSESIVAVANSLMRKIPTLSHKERMTAMRSTIITPVKPEIRYFHRFASEVNWIIDDIIRRQVLGEKSIAILSKYNNVLYQFEEAFVQKKIPCKLMTDEKLNKRKGKETDIILSTFHASKGLEWDTVYIVKLHDGAFPQKKDEESIDEERRLFYVAVTRARNNLVMTYSKGEKNMCRFLREIHRPLLRWYSIAQHIAIDEEVLVENKDIESYFMSWTGENFRSIKAADCLPLNMQEQIKVSNYFRQGESYCVPDWVFRLDSISDFYAFIRYGILREIGIKYPESAGEWDEKIRLSLFRIRILKEDLPVFEKEKELIHACVTELFPARLGADKEPPPIFEFGDLEKVITVLSPGREWIIEEMIAVMQILHKIRSVIYNLRHVPSELNEFLLGPAKGSPPMIMRNDLITCWRRVTTRTIPNKLVLFDLYRLACVHSSRIGRNAPLYKTPEITDLSGCLPFLEDISDHFLQEIQVTNTSEIQARVVLNDSILDLTCEIDLIVGDTVFVFLEGESKAEVQRLDRWIEGLARVSIARAAKYTIKNLVYIQPLSGAVARLSLTTWDDARFRKYIQTR